MAFQRGEFGMSVHSDVTIQDSEAVCDGHNRKMVDDGSSGVLPLTKCEENWREDIKETLTEDSTWTGNIVDIFKHGLTVKVVGYPDDTNRAARFRWNVAQHDQENNTVRWSTPHQKIEVASGLYNTGCIPGPQKK